MNYGTLKTDVAGYLHRTDLTTPIIGFIDKARVRIGGELRAIANYVSASVTSFSVGLSALPTNLSDLVSVTQDDRPLLYILPGEVRRFSHGGVYSIEGGDLLVPDATATTVINLTYFAIPDPLVNDADVGIAMLEWPQLWTFAAVAEGALYVQNMELAAVMNEAYGQMLRTANMAGDRARFGPAPAISSDQFSLQGMAVN
jgi:hypothetical protein